MVLLYWDLGRAILENQKKAVWGAKVIDRLSFDLQSSFPDMKGFSPRNLKYMRAFASAWPDKAIVQRIVAQIPWRQNIALLEGLQDRKLRLWYAEQTLRNGWSKPLLKMQIESRCHERQGKAVTNFKTTLPPPDSDLAGQIFKDPYVFDFLGTADPRREAEIEQALVDHIQRFLLELSTGFAFVGQLNLYLSAVDDLLRHPDDQPAIGLLLCREKNRVVVEYALRHLKRPIGVAKWETKLVEELPKELKGSLPTVQEIEAELEGRK